MAGIASKAKKPFSRGILSVYKDHAVTRKNLIEWTRLTLYFEDRSLREGTLFVQTIPRYPEWFQTGVVAIGFGLDATRFQALARYWRHEWIVTALLGKQTADFYSKSPLLSEHEYRHITRDMIKSSLDQFVGQVVQHSCPPLLIKEDPDQLDRTEQAIKGNTCRTLSAERETVDEGVNGDIGGDRDDERQDERGVADSEMINNSSLGKGPNLRIKQCHSIELLQMAEATVRLRVISDGLFNCRSFVRDLGLHLGCHSVIDQLHLSRLGPLTAEQALAKHELHLGQINECILRNSAACEQYLSELKELYPNASSKHRRV